MTTTMNHPADIHLTDIMTMDRSALLEYIVSLRQFAGIAGEDRHILEDRLARLSIERLRAILYATRRIIHERGY